jgi:hypothetical protein
VQYQLHPISTQIAEVKGTCCLWMPCKTNVRFSENSLLEGYWLERITRSIPKGEHTGRNRWVPQVSRLRLRIPLVKEISKYSTIENPHPLPEFRIISRYLFSRPYETWFSSS